MRRPPYCKKCKGYNLALGDAGVFSSIPFWYCQDCKVEVDDWGFEVKAKTTMADVDEELAAFVGAFKEDDEEQEDSVYTQNPYFF